VSYPRPNGWLHKRGIARVVNSESGSMHSRVIVRAQSPRWLPAAVMRWHLNRDFAHSYASRAATHRMMTLGRSKPTAAGVLRWEAVFDPARPQVVWHYREAVSRG
jgi:hypothetical protein